MKAQRTLGSRLYWGTGKGGRKRLPPTIVDLFQRRPEFKE